MGVLHLCVLLGTAIIGVSCPLGYIRLHAEKNELQFSVTLSFLSSSQCGCELPCCLHQ